MKLYYAHDPMCSWCWAFRPVWLELRNKLPRHVEWVSLLGGLAPDSDAPMTEKTRDYIVANWRRIEEQAPTTKFNYRFWTECQPRRSTYPACRAVIAARQQGKDHDAGMTYAVQRAYYLQARNPSDEQTLIALADEIGLNVKQFREDLLSESINQQLLAEISKARQLQLDSFPGLLLVTGSQRKRIQHNYQQADAILDQII